MTRVPRSRARSRSITGTFDDYYNGGHNGHYSNTITFQDSCSDRVGRPVVDSPFTLSRVIGDGAKVSGEVYSSYLYPTYRRVYDKYPVPMSNVGLETSTLPAPSGWYLDAVARSNPSRPVMTPFELIQDLIDIPKQLHQLGSLIRKPVAAMNPHEAASHYLCVQFGWIPLIEDLRQLLDLQSHAIKRSAELYKLYSGKGLKRRLSFAHDTQVGDGVYRASLPGPANYVDIRYDIKVERRSWATIRWKPTSFPLYNLGDAEWNSYCKRIVSGMTVEGLTRGAWQVLPWTWLLGWFTNVGRYTLAHSNTVPATHTGACFMSESRRTYSVKGVDYIGAKGSLDASGTAEWVTKTRIVSGALTPGFNVPFLDTFRLSILGALFTQRTMRWKLFT